MGLLLLIYPSTYSLDPMSSALRPQRVRTGFKMFAVASIFLHQQPNFKLPLQSSLSILGCHLQQCFILLHKHQTNTFTNSGTLNCMLPISLYNNILSPLLNNLQIPKVKTSTVKVYQSTAFAPS